MNIKGKNISIIGAVRSGVGAAKLAKKMGAVPFVSDSAPYAKIEIYLQTLIDNKIDFEFGGHSERVHHADLIVTSPGVPSNSEVLLKVKELGLRVVSELEFASWFCKGKIIAITGSNGKTTTTSLCGHMLETAGKKVFTAGNIGLAFSEIVLSADEQSFVVLEVSSFQLDHIESFKPYISVLLNITPDHLDRYENDFEKYRNSKMRITANQDGSDYFVYNIDDKKIPLTISTAVQKYEFGATSTVQYGTQISEGKFIFYSSDGSEEICETSALFVKGIHNQYNAAATATIGKIVGISNTDIQKAFESFKGVEHRVEFVKEYKGVKYYNDSKATNVDSVWYALKSFEEPIILILGGKDKGNDYNELKNLVHEKVKKIYAIGSSAEKVKSFFGEIVNTELKDSFDDCIKSSLIDAVSGDVLLLSPACASFDMFNNYEHRGEEFKNSVNRILL